MSGVVNIAEWRDPHDLAGALEHPSGVTFPVDSPVAAEIITPSLHAEISGGTYAASMVASLENAIADGDRVLVIGTALGILSTLAAKSRRVSEVIAIEMDSRVIPLINRVHALNGVRGVQTLNGVPTSGQRGGVPVFARFDPRMSSPLPDEGAWSQAMLVPFVDLGLILADEKISLIVCDVPYCAAQMISEVELGGVERILISAGDRPLHFWQDGEPGALLKDQGFFPEISGTAVLACRDSASRFLKVS